MANLTPRPLPPCDYCGAAVDPKLPGTYERITGWTRRRWAGGANQITMQRKTGVYRHEQCMEDAKAGRHPGQEKLFDG